MGGAAIVCAGVAAGVAIGVPKGVAGLELAGDDMPPGLGIPAPKMKNCKVSKEWKIQTFFVT